MRRGRKIIAGAGCAAVAALAAAAGQPVGLDEAAAKPAKGLRLSPKPGAQVPARPLTVRVRTPQGAKRFRARLNGRSATRHFRGSRGGVRKLRASPTHGLRYGRNRLTVRLRRANGKKLTRISRFRMRRNRPLAAAGRDRRVEVGTRVRLNGRRSRSHAAMAGTGRAGLAHRWKVVEAPDGVRRGAVLKAVRSPRPSFEATVPGTYRIRLRVTARDGRKGSDLLVLRADPAPVAPHIDAVAAKLRDRNPGTEGKLWGISTDNSLPGEWLLQTPNCWGMSSCGAGPLPPSADRILTRMTAIASSAEKSVELTGLWPPPDGEFRDAIVAGLKQAVAAGRKPTLRVILGTPPLEYSNSQFTAWIDALVADVGGDLPVQAAAMSTYPRFGPATSWNHSKLLAADGRSAIVGGMNYWQSDYLQVKDPVNDVSITVDGAAAGDAVDFADVLWGWICENRNRSSYVSLKRHNVDGCISKAQTLPTLSGTGNVPILTIGRLGNGIEVPGEAGRRSPPIPKPPVPGSACNPFQRQVSDTNTDRGYEYRNPGETGLRALIASAEESVFISQQDLLSCAAEIEAYFDDRVMAALGEKVVAGIPVTIVLADEGAKAGSNSYSTGNKITDLAKVLTEVVAAEKPAADARKLVCKGVGLAGVRTLDAKTWPDGNPFANHAKLVAVDDAAFYVGSENLYPARLQELGMIVEDDAAAATLRSDYLDPLWHRSREGALIDPEKSVCGSF